MPTLTKSKKIHEFVIKGTNFSSLIDANHKMGWSKTDVLSQMFLQIINLVLLFSSPLFAVRYSKVLSNFFEETARVGRKLTSDGLISTESAKAIAGRSVNRFALKVILVTLIISSYIQYSYFYLVQLEFSLQVDFGNTFHFFWISILPMFPMIFPPTAASIENAMTFSVEFCNSALEKWRKDFKNEFEKIRSELAAGQENVNPGILWNSKSLVFNLI